MVPKSAYDGLFNTFFLVISLTVAPFVSSQIVNPIRGYGLWAALAFYLPLSATIILWGYAVFSDSVRYRIASWSSLIYQITRAPFATAVYILRIPGFVQAVSGAFSAIPIVVEIAASMIPAFLIMKHYCVRVARKKSPRRADYLAWAVPIILFGVYSYFIAFYSTLYFGNL